MSPPEFISARRVPVAHFPKERPMLYAAPMVRALLDGTKTQTRRVLKPQPIGLTSDGAPFVHTADDEKFGRLGKVVVCPYGQPGDRLWVRETWAEVPRHEPHTDEDLPWRKDGRIVVYAAEPHWNGSRQFLCADGVMRWARPQRWTPSIHMPRWASRIDLEVTVVRVERLQDMSDDDFAAEGIQELIDAGVDHDGTPRDTFRVLWDSLNGKGAWAANPWVWAVSFVRIKP